MLKYVKIDGYINIGELGFMTHFYQFIEPDTGNNNRMTILVHAYEGETKVFKGYLMLQAKTYESIPMTSEEIEAIEKATGKLTEVGLKELIDDSLFERQFIGFNEAKSK